MKKFLVFCMVSAVVIFSVHPVSADLVKIADNVYSYLDVKNPSPENGYGANAGMIIGKDGIVVIDT